MFFAVSGYFIAKSFDRRKLLVDFAAARVCRIVPGLAVALALTAFALGPSVTTLSWVDYARQPGTWIYVPQNLLLAHLRFDLPGVFAGNPFPAVANASLWTLKYEVACYAGVVAAGYTGLLRPRTFPVILIVAAIVTVLVPRSELGLSTRLAVLCTAFAIGAAGYVYRSVVPVSVIAAVLLALLAALAYRTPLYPLSYTAALSYAALWFGFSDLGSLTRYNRLGDFSYGVYIYAFPVGQALVWGIPGLTPWSLIALDLPLTLALAVASWTWIERPALAHRHRLAALLQLGRREASVQMRDNAPTA